MKMVFLSFFPSRGFDRAQPRDEIFKIFLYQAVASTSSATEVENFSFPNPKGWKNFNGLGNKMSSL